MSKETLLRKNRQVQYSNPHFVMIQFSSRPISCLIMALMWLRIANKLASLPIKQSVPSLMTRIFNLSIRSHKYFQTMREKTIMPISNPQFMKNSEMVMLYTLLSSKEMLEGDKKSVYPINQIFLYPLLTHHFNPLRFYKLQQLMEYSAPYPSSVPHIILIPDQFQLDQVFFIFSIIIQCFITFVCLIFFGMAIYFRIKNQKLLTDFTQSGTAQNRQKQNIICQILEKTDYLGKMEKQESEQSDKTSQNTTQSAVSQDNKVSDHNAVRLRLIQRRFNYFMSYIVMWTICLSLFDYDIILIVSLALFLVFTLLFNIYRIAPDWKITFLFYILPLFMSISAYLDGYSPPYTWTKVTESI